MFIYHLEDEQQARWWQQFIYVFIDVDYHQQQKQLK
jgi:hypothetical protein